MSRKAFTLIELLVVVAIITILASLIFGAVGGCNNYSIKTSGVYQVVKTYTTNINETNTSKRVDLRPKGGGLVETMRCDDNGLIGVYNSATLYAQFEAGKWYSVESTGERNEARSQFPYVVSVSEVPDPTK